MSESTANKKIEDGQNTRAVFRRLIWCYKPKGVRLFQ